MELSSGAELGFCCLTCKSVITLCQCHFAYVMQDTRVPLA